MKATRHIIVAIVVSGMLSACKDVPDYVLGKKEMASLLVDIHKGESVLEYERSRYYNDSLKKMMKQSVYARHGVTAEQVDTSFVWYGNHIEEYLEVYDDVIARLEKELADSDMPGDAPVFAAGDSVDVWSDSPQFRITASNRIKNLTFNLEPDDNWERGDNYQFQFKVINPKTVPPRMRLAIFADYDDGSTDYKASTVAGEGWTRLRLLTDSTKVADSVYGYLLYDVEDDETVYLDSVSLVRTRLMESNYYQRNSQRQIKAVGDTVK